MSASGFLFLGTVIAALITGYFSLRVARSSRAANAEALTAAPYEQLSTRVTTLEAQVDTMRRRQWRTDNDLDTAVDALWQQQLWIESGAVPPPPSITARALEVVHRRRAERAETEPQPSPKPEDVSP